MKWLFFMGFFMTLPVTTDEFDEIDWINLPFDAIWRIIFVVLGTTFLTYFLNLFALKKTSNLNSWCFCLRTTNYSNFLCHYYWK